LEPYGFLILLVLMMTNVLTWIMAPPLTALRRLLFNVAGL